MLDPALVAELRRRRDAALEALGDGALVLFSAPVHQRNNDVEHPYRQHSDFYYLTGFEEPEAALVLRKKSPSLTLFVRERDPEREQWDGRRAGTAGAVEIYGAEQAFPIEELEKRLPDLLEDAISVAYLIGEEERWDRLVIDAVGAVKRRRRKKVRAPERLLDAAVALHAARRLKSAFEVGLLERVCELTARGHRRAMQVCTPGMHEYELQAELEAVFRRGGAERMAYESIVGSGENATILHYRENRRPMQEGDLVLIDAGAELGLMAADITRTFPVGGRFTAPQRKAYELVLAAHAAAVSTVRAGATLEDVHSAAFEVIAQGLCEWGWVDPSLEKKERDAKVQRYFMHRTSHYLGMDVHDVGPYHLGGASLPLEPGVVITVEPGLYISPGDEDAPEEYWSIGIRIEDDVLVEPDGARILTGGVPREVEAIEELCSARL